MKTQGKDVKSVLENLIQVCNDGSHGYRTAAEDVDNPEYKTLFHAYSQQRNQFATELEREGSLLGRDTDAGESILSALHRGWINIKSAFTSGGTEAILTECRNGDKAALEAYENALEKSLPANIEVIVRRQYNSIREAYDKINTFVTYSK
jgi:uncharacterized protein (TIGR02284 family)